MAQGDFYLKVLLIEGSTQVRFTHTAIMPLRLGFSDSPGHSKCEHLFALLTVIV